MKVIGITSTAILSLLLGIGGPAYAQQEQHDEKQDRPEQQQSKHEQGKHEQGKSEQAKPEQQRAEQQRQPDQKRQQETQRLPQENQAKQPEPAQQQPQNQNRQQPQRAEQQQQKDQNKQQHAQQQDQNNQQQRAQQQKGDERPQRTQEQQRVEQSAWQKHRSQRWDSDHRTWQQRGGYNGYRIPDDRFRGYFGQDHGFRISGLAFLVVGGYPRFQYSGYWISLVDPWPEYWGNDWYDTDDVYVTYVDNGYYLFDRRYPNVGIAISISM